jgi:hypothetical protein
MSTTRRSPGCARDARPPVISPEVIARHAAEARALRAAYVRGLALAAWRLARRLAARGSRAASRTWGPRTTM